MKKKGIVVTIIIVVVFVAVGICAGYLWKDYNRYDLKQNKVTVELGSELQIKAEDYINANETALNETELDTSNVNTMEAGTYEVTATWKDHSVKIKTVVEDTTAPVITLKETKDLKVLVGKELKATDLVKKVEDLAGVKKVSFDKNQIELKTKSKELLGRIGLKFDTAGKQTVTFIAEDNNGNKAEKEITVKVIEDYLSHVSGFKDITIEQGMKPDYLKDIVKDEKIAEITVDESTVDLNTPGEYQIKYIIKGDDGETTVEQTVKVIVKEKPKPVQKPKSVSSGGNNSGGNSGGASAPAVGNSSSGSNVGGGSSWLDSLTPGQTFEYHKTSDNYDDPNAGVHCESGYW